MAERRSSLESRRSSRGERTYSSTSSGLKTTTVVGSRPHSDRRTSTDTARSSRDRVDSGAHVWNYSQEPAASYVPTYSSSPESPKVTRSLRKSKRSELLNSPVQDIKTTNRHQDSRRSSITREQQDLFTKASLSTIVSSGVDPSIISKDSDATLTQTAYNEALSHQHDDQQKLPDRRRQSRGKVEPATFANKDDDRPHAPSHRRRSSDATRRSSRRPSTSTEHQGPSSSSSSVQHTERDKMEESSLQAIHTSQKPKIHWPTMEGTHQSDSGISVTGSGREHSALALARTDSKQPSVEDASDASEKAADETASSEGYEGHVPHADDDRLSARLQQQEEALRHHIQNQPYQAYAYSTSYGKRSAPSVPSTYPDSRYSSPPPLFHPQPMQYPNTPYYNPGMLVPYNAAYAQSAPQVPPQAPMVHTPDLTKKTLVGYELLATRLAGVPGKPDSPQPVTPLYRKYEKLNHRILLHLQDEIAELEEELRVLDECIAQSAEHEEDNFDRDHSSRRADLRSGNDMRFRRTDLLGRIFVKIGQYNQALAAYNNMIKSLDPAKADDLKVYRDWMSKNSPIPPNEARYLEEKDDLLRLGGQRAHGRTQIEPVQVGLIAAVLIFLLPLMAISVIPGFFARLFVVLVIAAAEAIVVITWTDIASLLPMEEWRTYGAVYFAIMTVVAGIVR